MKNVILMAAVLITSSAYACPELAGNYTCTINGQTSKTTVAQSVVNNVTQYQINQDNQAWSPIVTDGVERDFQGVQGVDNGRYTASCPDATQAIVNVKGKVMDNGQAVGDIALVLKVSKSTANLVIDVTGNLSGDFGNSPIDEQTNTCVPQ